MLKNYFEKPIVDFSFGIKSKAFAVAHLLGDLCVENISSDELAEMAQRQVEFTTTPFYNGRERGICIVMSIDGTKNRLKIFFSEHKTSDCIVVGSWIGKYTNNPPTVEDVPEEVWGKRKMFAYNEIQETADYILGLIRNHFQILLKEIETEK